MAALHDALNWLKSKVARHPLACVAVSAVAGILLADVANAFTWGWLAAVTLVAVLWRPRPWLLCLAAALVFGYVHQCCLETSRGHPLRQMLEPGQRITAVLRGEFVRAQMIPDEEPGRRQALLEVKEIILPTRKLSITGETRIRVWLSDPTFVPQGGDYELEGSLSLVQRAWNPVLFDPAQTALRQGIVAELYPRRTELMGEARFSWILFLLRYAEICRQWIAHQLAVGIEDQAMPRTLVTTMALGTAETDTTTLEEPFRNSGTLHVFAVSGLHVALLAAVLLPILRVIFMGRIRAIMILVPLLFAYAFVTGWVPSAARAAFMAAVMLVAPLMNRQSRLLNSLGAAALVLLTGGTQQLFQPGFQLSFGVLAAIAIGAHWVSTPLQSWAQLDPFLPRSMASRWQTFGALSRQAVLSLFATSTAAWIGSLLLMVYHFHACTPVSVVANCLLVPLSSASLGTVVLSLMAAACQATWLQGCLNNANWFFAYLMMGSATGFSSLPGSHFPLSAATFTSKPDLSLCVLSMPPGEGAQLLQSGGQAWMLDCGGTQQHRRNMLPFLRQHDVGSLDGLVLSHADADHGGAAKLLYEPFGSPSVFSGPHEPWRLDSRATALWQLNNQLAHEHQTLQKLQASAQLRAGEADLHVLFPTAQDVRDKGDDRGLVVRIDCKGFRILWCNDAGFYTEKALLSRWAPSELRSDVMLRNQHASDLSALPEFLLAVQPQAVITSNAPLISEQRLPSHLIQHCERYKVRLFDQYETGMVRIEVDGEELRLEPWLKGEPMVLHKKSD